MNILLGIIGIIAVIGLAFLLSEDRKKVKWKSIAILLLMQILATLFMLKTSIGKYVVDKVSELFTSLIGFGTEGVNFVFGGITYVNDSVSFFFSVLLVVIFFSALISILNYLYILPIIIKYIGKGVSKITGISPMKSFVASASVFLGQSEVFLTIKEQLPKASRTSLFVFSTSAMGSVSASLMGAYMSMLEPKYVLLALPLNMFAALIIASIVMPSDEVEEEIDIKKMDRADNIFDAISTGILDGGKVALIVGAMLVGYVALMSCINALLGSLIHTDLQTILGYIFSPFAILMGVPIAESVAAGGIMATKLVLNEFVAMLQLSGIEGLSDKTIGVVSVFLVSFANFSSIGIIGGTVMALNHQQGKVISSFGLKLLASATLASILSATIAGLFL